MNNRLFCIPITLGIAAVLIAAAPVTAAEGEPPSGEKTAAPAGDKFETMPDSGAKPAEETTAAGNTETEDGGGDTGDGTKTRQPATDRATAPREGGGNMMYLLLMIGGFFILMMFLSGRGKRKQQKKHQELLDALKKGDRIVTIGGLCGNVVEVREKEIVAKVGENARITLARWAIRAAGEEAGEDRQKDTRDDQ